jgi:NADH-quinone oxidoreductase subunit L
MDQFVASWALPTLLAPLAGCAILAFLGPRLSKAAAAFVGCASIFVSFVFTVALAWHVWHLPAAAAKIDVPLGTWFHAGALTIGFGLLVDPLALVWMLVITGVGFLIHLYSAGYMSGEKNYRTFFSYMNLFVFTMLLLVMSDDFLWLLVGWGGVGLASYLLIGFNYDRPSAVLAARKALIMNVIGDVGIMIAIFLMFALVRDVSFAGVFSRVMSVPTASLDWIGIWLLVGAVAKSAQLPLHTWLPDAMEGPTPVSALIHAATMVTAGVYLVARCHPIYDHAPLAAEIVACVGAASALFAATIGCVQYDIKRVLAYSTMSQIGYMIAAVGVGAYSAGAFHFLTHAYFKALLFLAAGIVIHNLGGEQDIRKMGGLAKRMPFAYWTFTIGTLAIAGIPPFAGFWSKDAVIAQAARLGHPVVFAFLVASALLTAFYMFRLLIVTFAGEFRGSHEPHADTNWTMSVAVGVLAVLAVCGGWVVLPGHDVFSALLAPTFADALHAQYLGNFEWESAAGTFALVVAGILMAYSLYIVAPAARQSIKSGLSGLRTLLLNAYYLDAVYHVLFEVPAYALASALSRVVDPAVIAGVPRAMAGAAFGLGEASRGWENGYLRRYGLTIVVGAALLLYLIFFVARSVSPMGTG